MPNRRTGVIIGLVWLVASGSSVNASGTFVGDYKGHELSVTLASADGISYTGTIRMSGGNGENSFPLRATDRDGKLSGTFTADREEYEFVASLDGEMLSFDSGGTIHILRKQASAGGSAQNPLSGAGKPPASRADNPLDRRADHARAAPNPKAMPAMKFARLSVADPGINNIECVSFLIPAGWRVEGGVKWFPNYSILANLLMTITDPQTGAAIQFLPIQNFTFLSNPVVPMDRGHNYFGNIVWELIQDVPTLVQTFYLRETLPHLRDARVVGRESLRNVARQIAENYGGQSQVVCERVRYEFQANGRAWEEDVYATIVYTENPLGINWSVTSSYSFRAPKGLLDQLTPVMNTTIRTVRLNLDWFAGYQYVQKLFNDRMMGSIEDAKKISDMITRNSEEIRRMYSESYRKANESQDRISASYSEYIRGVDTYNNPYEDRSIQLPSGYDDAWVNAKGEYLLSNEAGFDPNVRDTTEWRRMTRRGQDQ